MWKNILSLERVLLIVFLNALPMHHGIAIIKVVKTICKPRRFFCHLKQKISFLGVKIYIYYTQSILDGMFCCRIPCTWHLVLRMLWNILHIFWRNTTGSNVDRNSFPRVDESIYLKMGKIIHNGWVKSKKIDKKKDTLSANPTLYFDPHCQVSDFKSNSINQI